MENRVNIRSIFKQEENVEKFNAIITIPDLKKGNGYKYNDGKNIWFCKNFGAYASSNGYNIPEMLYYLDRRILLLVFWLDQYPTEKDLENRDNFSEFLKENPPVNCRKSGREFNIKSKFKDPYMMHDEEIKCVFMLPYDQFSNTDKQVKKDVIEQIIYYRYIELEINDRNIHCGRMLTAEVDKVNEVEFIGDHNRYFKVSKVPECLIANKYLMKRASLKDICTNEVTAYDPGVYALLLHGEIKKIGKAEGGIYQRLCDYYFPDRREQSGGRAGARINEKSKDDIEVVWMECSKELCRDMEREVQMTINYLGHYLEWDDKYEFNNKEWQKRCYEYSWKPMLNRFLDMGLLDEIIREDVKRKLLSTFEEFKEIRNTMKTLMEDNTDIKGIVKMSNETLDFLSQVVDDIEI